MHVDDVLNDIRQRREMFIEHEAGMVIDGIRQAADGLDDRQGSIALGVELSQTARFVTRGHQKGVAACHRQVGEWFGIADMDTDLPREAILELSELPLQVAITAADHHELATGCDEGLGRIDDHIETFLPVQSADDDEDRPGCIIRQPKMSTKLRSAVDLSF